MGTAFEEHPHVRIGHGCGKKVAIYQVLGNNLVADGGKYFAEIGHHVAWLPGVSTLLSGGTEPISIKSSSAVATAACTRRFRNVTDLGAAVAA
jgi:hypothetical protein